ncbi:MAG: hypothetical protein IH944_10395 [Armatimonadetes bacterium]|nr:hypothetical protein [Armatimonadota bacterium]
MLIGALFVLVAQQQDEVWIGTVYPETHPPIVRDRVEFTKKFDQIEKGLTMRQVRSILGPPDDVLEEDEWNWGMYPTATVWKYGSTGKHMLGTYGRVVFEKNAVDSFTEGVAKRNLEDEAALIQAMQSMWLYGFYSNPFRQLNAGLDRLRAANALIELGEDGARIALQEYSREASYRYGDGIPLLIEMLFLPDGIQEAAAPEGLRQKWIVAGGVPFLMAGGMFRGNGYNAVSHYDSLLKANRFRQSRFRPDDDLSEIGELAGAVLAKGEDRAIALLGVQLIDLLSSVFEPPAGMDIDVVSGKASARLPELVADMRAVKVKWDVERQAFRPANGRMLERGRPLYKVFRWIPDPIRDSGVEIQVVRESESIIEIRLTRVVPASTRRPSVPSLTLLVEESEGDHKLLGYAKTFEGRQPLIDKLSEGREFKQKVWDKGVGEYVADNLYDKTRWSYWTGVRPRFGAGSSGSSRLEENPRLFEKSSMSLELGAQPFRLRVIVDGQMFVSPILRP